MRRFKQQLPDKEVKQILHKSTSGVLSLVDSDNIPYGVPMSFVYDGEKAIYFHCAKEGKKIDCIRNNPHASFTVIDLDEIHPEKFTTFFRSVIASGIISFVTDETDRINALRLLTSKYSPGIDDEQEIASGLPRVTLFRLDISSVTGKEAIELTRKRNDCIL
ncbi:MAG: pyridoxamine 5'-phosphate oxidase family protein [Paramuribaculum sp.]|nr:pyridoxamine 5'-phosphate oxidase family protein [Paramuribaculum sp.]